MDIIVKMYVPCVNRGGHVDLAAMVIANAIEPVGLGGHRISEASAWHMKRRQYPSLSVTH